MEEITLHNKKWLPEDDEWLRNNYDKYRLADLADYLGRTQRAIRVHMYRLGLRHYETRHLRFVRDETHPWKRSYKNAGIKN